jgi:quercetin dioxygenase-like cupin family protein
MIKPNILQMKNESIENALSFHTPDRLLDAPLLIFDLHEVVEKIKQEPTWKMGERNAITLLKSPFMRILLIALHKKMEINFHQSGNIISVQIIEGKVNFQSLMLKKGSLLTLHEDTKHTLYAIEESVILLTITLFPEKAL